MNNITKITTYITNENGLSQIHAHLSSLHKLGGDHFTRDMLLAWAADAERNMNDAGQPAFEISAWDSVSGRTELCRITDDGFDKEETNIEDDE